VSIFSKLRSNWPEYLMEAWALGVFMLSAGFFAVLIEAPGSPVRSLVADPHARLALNGAAMGLTAMAIIYSPWGRRSGAHMNPAVTLSFLMLGRTSRVDAMFYVIAQLIGGVLGVLAALALFGEKFTAPPVNWVQTLPGPSGAAVAYGLETAMAFGLMTLVLTLSNHARFAPLTGVAAGLTVATYISLEAPFSGMSINPARTFASAAPTGGFEHLWLYVTAPIIGMQLAALAWRRRRVARCAKLIHTDRERCIHCGFEPAAAAAPVQLSSGGTRS